MPLVASGGNTYTAVYVYRTSAPRPFVSLPLQSIITFALSNPNLMRTRSSSKRPPSIPPEELEEDSTAAGSSKPSSVKRKKETGESKRNVKGKELANPELSTAINTSEKEEEDELNNETTINHHGEDATEMDWEDGDIPSSQTFAHNFGNQITIEFTDSPSPSEKKTPRKVSAKEKELTELVYKVHLLCLLARGRFIDKACNDPLIQASMLSLIPSEFLKITEVPNLTIYDLKPLVNWFHSKFHISNDESANKGSFKSNLESALQNYEGNSEELAALSVILFRALNLTTRFVSVLDISNRDETQRLNPKAVPVPVPSSNKPSTSKSKKPNITSPNHEKNKEIKKEEELSKFEEPKRKGDVEFELQLQMALSATETTDQSANLQPSPSNLQSSPPNLGKSQGRGKSAIWSRNGPSFYWAEVYCAGEMLTGRWIHVDCINGVINGEDKVENNFVVCKKPLIYALAFNSNGAKDVTRRYCVQWFKIAGKRVKEEWWERVLAPLTQLESRQNGLLGERNGILEDRNSVEDIELENRALTEPLPTNQQAYKYHNQYAIEKWLNKNQIIYPKGPVLGFCSGHPVYPRILVHTLQTRQSWMKLGLQVKANELPAKKVSRSKKKINFEPMEIEKEIGDFEGQENNNANIELYGKWQLEPLKLPHAINGIVPKNEYGNVEVWSEKCVPPGTVHLRLPRMVPVANRLEIDFAQALVGFEFQKGKTYPVFEGIVVCTEFKDALLEAYKEEESRREIEEKKRDEKQALTRWFQLISSIAMRQRLKNSYAGPSSTNTLYNVKSDNLRGNFEKEAKRAISEREIEHEHEHVFPLEKQSFDEDTCVRTKICDCGYSLQVEEL